MHAGRSGCAGFGGEFLTADAEGADIYYGPGASGYVLMSSQGSDTIVVYKRQGNNEPIGALQVTGVNGVDETLDSAERRASRLPHGPAVGALLRG